jgi:DNA-binding LacI/PurR family transcriptional regulator
MIVLVMVRFTNPFYARLLQEFSAKLQALKYWILLQAIHQPQTEHVVCFMAPSLVVQSSARVVTA